MVKRRSRENNNNTSSQSLRRREFSTADINIPLDLTVEILKQLQAKSLVRFQCVSKQWSTIIGYRKDLIDSTMTRSLTHSQPCDVHLIFHHQSEESSFFIFTHPQNTDQTSVSIPGITVDSYGYLRGLILCCSHSFISVAIYNPTTMQSLLLPRIQMLIDDLFNHVFVFGYDPVKNKYKVVCLITKSEELENTCFVFTLRDPKKQWRNIKCSIEHHYPWLPSVCIDGAIYYRATKDHGSSFFLVRFDVRSEKFNHVEVPKELIDNKDSSLINYQGKLGFVLFNESLEIWVMEDAKKQEWSKIIVNSPIGSGEIVFVNKMVVSNDTVSVVYFDPKQLECSRLVGIQGTSAEERKRNHLTHILGVPFHVENTMCLY